MKDKEKQIEEMADIIFNSKYKNDYISPLKGANELYNAGYRKLPENVFILTNDNAEELANLIVTSPQMQSVMEELITAWQKETAEKIYRMADEICTGSQNDGDKILAMIKDTFSIEIKE